MGNDVQAQMPEVPEEWAALQNVLEGCLDCNPATRWTAAKAANRLHIISSRYELQAKR